MRRRVSWGAPLGSAVLGTVLIAMEVSLGHASLQKAFEAVALLVVFCGALVLLQVRSETARVLAGQSVDERWDVIHEHALAAAAGIGIVIGIAAYAVVEVRGGENWQFAFMIIAISLGYLGALAWYRWRL